MENEFDIFENFVGTEIYIKQNDDTKISGTLVSIDGYLNLFIINGQYITLENTLQFKSLFVRGTVVDYIYKK